jgi:hypothetical protein
MQRSDRGIVGRLFWSNGHGWERITLRGATRDAEVKNFAARKISGPIGTICK